MQCFIQACGEGSQGAAGQAEQSEEMNRFSRCWGPGGQQWQVRALRLAPWAHGFLLLPGRPAGGDDPHGAQGTPSKHSTDGQPQACISSGSQPAHSCLPPWGMRRAQTRRHGIRLKWLRGTAAGGREGVSHCLGMSPQRGPPVLLPAPSTAPTQP